MNNRQPISKALRFDIFRRDKFTCQYCGQKAPNILLEVDHIFPVSQGGGNNSENLITSCYSCNRGKGARVIDDIDTHIEKTDEDVYNDSLEIMACIFNSESEKYDYSQIGSEIIDVFIYKKTGCDYYFCGNTMLTEIVSRIGFVSALHEISSRLLSLPQNNDGLLDVDVIIHMINGLAETLRHRENG